MRGTQRLGASASSEERLGQALREAFIMKHVEGRSYEEMADLLSTTVGALKMRVHRAREALQALLEEKYA
jgi:RNA polymerase sigma-70 factor (ECF subfamily)